MQKNQITITNSHKHKHNNYNNNKKKRQIEQKRVCVLPFLTSSVPNLRLDDLIIDANASGGELNGNLLFRKRDIVIGSYMINNAFKTLDWDFVCYVGFVKDLYQ